MLRLASGLGRFTLSDSILSADTTTDCSFHLIRVFSIAVMQSRCWKRYCRHCPWSTIAPAVAKQPPETSLSAVGPAKRTALANLRLNPIVHIWDRDISRRRPDPGELFHNVHVLPFCRKRKNSAPPLRHCIGVPPELSCTFQKNAPEVYRAAN